MCKNVRALRALETRGGVLGLGCLSADRNDAGSSPALRPKHNRASYPPKVCNSELREVSAGQTLGGHPPQTRVVFPRSTPPLVDPQSYSSWPPTSTPRRNRRRRTEEQRHKRQRGEARGAKTTNKENGEGQWGSIAEARPPTPAEATGVQTLWVSVARSPGLSRRGGMQQRWAGAYKGGACPKPKPRAER